MRRFLITGGSGFIGSNLIRHLLTSGAGSGISTIAVLNLDLLTYAGNNESLRDVVGMPNYTFLQADVADTEAVRKAVRQFEPDVIVHLAAESHVDRSIVEADPFLHTNVLGTFTMLDAAKRYRDTLPEGPAERFRFLHVSTDEVYGSLGEEGIFTEETSYAPRNPYSATKAAADHLVRAWFHTYGLPILLTNCSNNYGPYQYPEKLIPLAILSALAGEPINIYGTGEHIRDWLHVEDHVRALCRVLEAGRPGETYNIGGENQYRVLDVVAMICEILDRKRPRAEGSYRRLVRHVADRPGNDLRYSVDAGKLHEELGWRQDYEFPRGLEATVDWYLANPWWWQPLQTGGLWKAPNAQEPGVSAPGCP